VYGETSCAYKIEERWVVLAEWKFRIDGARWFLGRTLRDARRDEPRGRATGRAMGAIRNMDAISGG
jgi:hypothetical protein